jgi:hypothetical protein
MSTEQRNDDLRLDYNETTDLMRGLTDVRFKLVAFVPTISGAAIAVLGRGKSTTSELLAVGLLGLVATVGIVIFDLRNTQLLDYAVLRAKSLEERLGFVSIFEPGSPGGLFTERPGRDLRLFGLAGVGHDRGLALVYSAAIGGWCYIVAWGALRALDVGDARQLGGVIGLIGAVVVLIEFVRIDGRPDRQVPRRDRAAAPDVA